MTVLAIYSDQFSGQFSGKYSGQDGDADPEVLRDFGDIADRLAALGVQMERWPLQQTLPGDADSEAVQAVYADEIARLNEQYGFVSVDVVALRPDNPNREEFRRKFLAEHTHSDFEIRFFVDGGGLFYLHVNGKVYCVQCEKGDLISVPANTTHWFDMGAEPDFKCIRCFRVAEGWVGDFTGSDISSRFPDYDQFRANLSR